MYSHVSLLWYTWSNSCHISFINPWLSNGLYSLEKLFLENNKITDISEKMI